MRILYTIVVTAGGPSVWKRGVIFKVRLSPQGHLFSQYYELYIHQCTYLDVRDYTEVKLIDMCWFGILQVLLVYVVANPRQWSTTDCV